MKLIFMKHTLAYIESEAKMGKIGAINRINEINTFSVKHIEKEKYIVFIEENIE